MKSDRCMKSIVHVLDFRVWWREPRYRFIASFNFIYLVFYAKAHQYDSVGLAWRQSLRIAPGRHFTRKQVKLRDPTGRIMPFGRSLSGQWVYCYFIDLAGLYGGLYPPSSYVIAMQFLCDFNSIFLSYQHIRLDSTLTRGVKMKACSSD